MGTLAEDLDEYARDISKISKQDFWKGIRVLMGMGGEISAWITVLVASVKGITLLAVLFPPALACHLCTPAICTKVMTEVSKVYGDLPTGERKLISTALSGIQALINPGEPDKIVKVLKIIVKG